jgi:hypothetical protein
MSLPSSIIVLHDMRMASLVLDPQTLLFKYTLYSYAHTYTHQIISMTTAFQEKHARLCPYMPKAGLAVKPSSVPIFSFTDMGHGPGGCPNAHSNPRLNLRVTYH